MSPTRVNGDESDKTVYTPAPASTPKTGTRTGSSSGTAAKTTTTTPITKTAGTGSSSASTPAKTTSPAPTAKAPSFAGSPKMAGDESDKVVYTPQTPSTPKATSAGSSTSGSTAKAATTVSTPKAPPTVGSPKMAGDESDRVVYTPMQPRTAPAASSGGGGGGKAGPVRSVVVAVPPRLNGDESDRIRYTPMPVPAVKTVAGGGDGVKAGPTEPPDEPSRLQGDESDRIEYLPMSPPDPKAAEQSLEIMEGWGEIAAHFGIEGIGIELGPLGPLLLLNAVAKVLDGMGLLPPWHGAPVPATTPVPRAYGQGGLVSRPTLALLGEAGPEAVIPLSRFGSLSGLGTASDAGGRGAEAQAPAGKTLTINVYATYDVSGQKLAEKTNEDLVRRLRNVLVPGI